MIPVLCITDTLCHWVIFTLQVQFRCTKPDSKQHFLLPIIAAKAQSLSYS